MQINVQLYGSLKSYAPDGKTNFDLELTLDTTLEEILSHLNIPYSNHVFLINGKRTDKCSVSQDGDKLVMFPEISGG